MLLSNFFCYLQHDAIADFLIDLDTIWKWVGFARKDNAKHFKENIDFIVSRQLQDNPQGGRPQEKIMLSVNTAGAAAATGGQKGQLLGLLKFNNMIKIFC